MVGGGGQGAGGIAHIDGIVLHGFDHLTQGRGHAVETVGDIGQLVADASTKVRDAVFGNVGTLQSFKVGADDAEYLAKEYAPVLTEQDIIGISNYKAYIKLNINNATSRPFSLATLYDTTGKNLKAAQILKEYSRLKYGRKKVFVDQEIAARIGIDLSSDITPKAPEVVGEPVNTSEIVSNQV